MKTLLRKLLEIQVDVDQFVKDTKSFGYNYADSEQVLNRIRPLMNDKKLLLKQEVIEIENTREDYVNSKGNDKSEILCKTKQKFTWIDVETNEREECLFAANGFNDWEKGLGSALTYAERYFLLKFFHVPTVDQDPDNKDRKASNKESRPKVDKWLTDSEFQQAKNLKNGQLQELLQKYNGKPYKDGKVYNMKKEYKTELLKTISHGQNE